MTLLCGRVFCIQRVSVLLLAGRRFCVKIYVGSKQICSERMRLRGERGAPKVIHTHNTWYLYAERSCYGTFVRETLGFKPKPQLAVVSNDIL